MEWRLAVVHHEESCRHDWTTIHLIAEGDAIASGFPTEGKVYGSCEFACCQYLCCIFVVRYGISCTQLASQYVGVAGAVGLSVEGERKEGK